MFFVVKVDQLKAMESFSLSEISEQSFEIKSNEELQTFSQNSKGFEVVFFGGSIYSLCPVIPRKGVILTNEKFQTILSELKEHGETTFREKVMMAKKSLVQNSEQCVLEFKDQMPVAKSQGPHQVQALRGKVTRVEELSQYSDLIDKAYLRMTDQGEIDLIVNVDHDPVPVFNERKFSQYEF